jgi:hypothetical protein
MQRGHRSAADAESVAQGGSLYVRRDVDRDRAKSYLEHVMDALSGWVTRHRMTVGLLWLAITVVGIVCWRRRCRAG